MEGKDEQKDTTAAATSTKPLPEEEKVDEELFKRAAKWIKEADAIVVTCGAGMSVDSGLPDYRGNEGLWKAYPPLAHLKLSLAGISNPDMIEKNPNLVWGFHAHRMKLYNDATPHAGYELLKQWGGTKNGNIFAVTSNVDGHFLKAGWDEKKFFEIHGSFYYLQCKNFYDCDGGEQLWKFEKKDLDSLDIDLVSYEAKEPLPACKFCGGIARVNALLFNDSYWVRDRSDEQEARWSTWLSNNDGKKIVVIEIGAGLAIPSIRMYSEKVVRNGDPNAKLIRLNLRDFNADSLTPMQRTDCYLGLPCRGLYGLQKIEKHLKEMKD